MKIINRKQLNAFGGINFIYEHLNGLQCQSTLESNLPPLANQSQYNWKDIFHSFLSIYYCGGDCIEDININLKQHLGKNPFCKIPSADRVLDRLKQLAVPSFTCRTERGTVEHDVNRNDNLAKLNTELLDKLGAFDQEELTVDYDNTIIFAEKKDSKRNYKRGRGYQPGVATINTDNILYIENRNGNSDAKPFQAETLENMFGQLKQNNVGPIDNFRADAASYQLEVIKTVTKHCTNFLSGEGTVTLKNISTPLPIGRKPGTVRATRFLWARPNSHLLKKTNTTKLIGWSLGNKRAKASRPACLHRTTTNTGP
ncbi:transposase [Yeosuana sp.]|uniref:transposase n=1 Tax=Yeosuana sp. TaxID=2529388 RepID=UPI004054E8F5|tara:strand:- start:5263 stop:6201 length:939 start_codon:yes stop_codon:yes gene_type:complete